MTQLEMAKEKKLTSEMEVVAESEGLAPDRIMELVASGAVVIPRNEIKRDFRVMGVGAGLRTKVNANLGTSPFCSDLEQERLKLETAVDAGADAVMDLSTGGDLDKIRTMVLDNSTVMVGTVPIYQAAVELYRDGKRLPELTADLLLDTIEHQCRQGVDFITVHCGVTRKGVELAGKRVAGIVSRGGAMIAAWMKINERENLLLEEYDKLLDIAGKYDVTLSLGDGLRPGAQEDATDRAQVHELQILGDLASKAYQQGVQVMIEGPGHVPLDQVEVNVKMQKRLCNNAPFYVLGPITTDVAPGYDHITSAIGGAVAAAAGADFLCYVTPAEHLKLPDPEDVREGVMAARIAAHTADLVKGVKGAAEWDLEISRRRRNLDWEKIFELSMDPEKARANVDIRNVRDDDTSRVCSMCGEFCAIDMGDELPAVQE